MFISDSNFVYRQTQWDPPSWESNSPEDMDFDLPDPELELDEKVNCDLPLVTCTCYVHITTFLCLQQIYFVFKL